MDTKAADPASADLLALMARLEGERPAPPEPSGLTADLRAPGRHLAAVHRMHLSEVNRLLAIIEDVAAGLAPAGAVAAEVGALTIFRNLRSVGTLCGRECQALMFHHNAEEEMVFPALSVRGSAAIKAIVAQLQREHEVVHVLLDQLNADAEALTRNPDATALQTARQTVHALNAVVKSHFGYEEAGIGDALGLYNII